MGIIRVNKQTGRFLVASAEVFEDGKLSFGARGLMAYLLTKPDNWEVRREHLMSASPAGKVAIQRMINELKRRGYMRRFQENDPKTGKFITVTEVYETIALNPDTRKIENDVADIGVRSASKNGQGASHDEPAPLETPTYGGTIDTVTTKPGHGSFRHMATDPAALPPNAYRPPDPAIVNSMISVLSGVCKGFPNLLKGENCEFYKASETLIENHIAEEQVRAFRDWWQKNGYYDGKPAVKTLMSEIENSISGVKKRGAKKRNYEIEKAIDELDRWVIGRQKASEFSSPHTITAIQKVGESALRGINQYNRKQLIQQFANEFERAEKAR